MDAETFLWVAIITNIVIACVAGSITKDRGHGSASGFLLGIMLGVIGLVIACCMPDRKK